MYLYSKGDELIPYTDIELAMSAVKELGIPVSGVRHSLPFHRPRSRMMTIMICTETMGG